MTEEQSVEETKQRKGFKEEDVANVAPAAAEGRGLALGLGSTEVDGDQDLDQSSSGGMGSREKARRRSGLSSLSGSLLQREAEKQAWSCQGACGQERVF